MMQRRDIVSILNNGQVPLEDKIVHCSDYLKSNAETKNDAEVLLHYALLLGQWAEQEHKEKGQWPSSELGEAVSCLAMIPDTYSRYDTQVRPYATQLYCILADATGNESDKVTLLVEGFNRAKGQRPFGLFLRLMAIDSVREQTASRMVKVYPDYPETDYARIYLAETIVARAKANPESRSSIFKEYPALTDDIRLNQMVAGLLCIDRPEGRVKSEGRPTEDLADKLVYEKEIRIFLKEARSIAQKNRDPRDILLRNTLAGVYKNWAGEGYSQASHYYFRAALELSDREATLTEFKMFFEAGNYLSIVGNDKANGISELLKTILQSPPETIQAQLPELRAAYLFSQYKSGQELSPELVTLDEPLCKLVVNLARGKDKIQRLRWSTLARRVHFGYDPLELASDPPNGLVHKIKQELARPRILPRLLQNIPLSLR